MKQILGAIRKAVEDFNLINDGDKIAVGVSGGKDSVTLLYGLKLFQHFSPVKYELEAISLTLGFDDFDLTPIKEFCSKIEVPYTIKETQIAKVVFDVRKEKNPCSLCAKMRRGALYEAVKERGCNKVALGHHADDAIETLFLSMLYSGRIKTFKPKSYLSRTDLHLIRPMVYIKEHQIIGAAKRHDIPTVKSPCPADKNTKREEMKQLLKTIYKEIPTSKDKILTAIQNKDQLGLWFE
ncbi:tRNA 2-thiocytidine(32) synthetase TtcA [Caldisalinibacter kiritimatiensis]|uniref:tRNA(Cytosine32)-2-thiocytidine synthetase n=1 Tax=Caldisalinibacter kiritimatiensis TaxID=1304284 RepID=R1ARH6_9FIRM|nr:tRNA 2-thiocytidine(32) synthetase TtcA [Caldisalinibacter kiritimatiensis]EOC99291.1 tRNA(Cytosine32)-2-thiocytidine synthetase [Caldisalinibacter kiritimatiensis]